MKRLPLIPTLVVGLAVAAMVALGVWQVQRREEKEALIAQYRANLSLPPMAYPELAPVAREAMFRKSQVHCLRVTGWQVTGGRTPGGQPGYRHLAQCATGAEGPGALIDMGVSASPTQPVRWAGGIVDGIVTTEPQHDSLISRLFKQPVPPRPMLVADVPAAGLAASAPPDPGAIPNNHLAYAVQWFVFAALAALIYGLALRHRRDLSQR